MHTGIRRRTMWSCACINRVSASSVVRCVSCSVRYRRRARATKRVIVASASSPDRSVADARASDKQLYSLTGSENLRLDQVLFRDGCASADCVTQGRQAGRQLHFDACFHIHGMSDIKPISVAQSPNVRNQRSHHLWRFGVYRHDHSRIKRLCQPNEAVGIGMA